MSRLEAHRRPGAHGGAQHAAGGERRDAELRLDLLSAGSTEREQLCETAAEKRILTAASAFPILRRHAQASTGITRNGQGEGQVEDRVSRCNRAIWWGAAGQSPRVRPCVSYCMVVAGGEGGGRRSHDWVLLPAPGGPKMIMILRGQYLSYLRTP